MSLCSCQSQTEPIQPVGTTYNRQIGQLNYYRWELATTLCS